VRFTLKPYKKLKSTLRLLGLIWNYCSDTGTIVRFDKSYPQANRYIWFDIMVWNVPFHIVIHRFIHR